MANKGLSSQGYGLSSSHVWMWELDYKENWAPKNWYFWTVVLEKTLESPLDCKEIQPVHPKGNQSWIFIGRTDAEAETPILWPSDEKNWLIWKDPDAGKDWRQEEKGMTEDETVGWHHWLDRHESEQAPKVGDEQHAAVHRVAKRWIRLSHRTEFHSNFPWGLHFPQALIEAVTRLGWEEVLPSSGCFLKLTDVSLSVLGTHEGCAAENTCPKKYPGQGFEREF